MTMIKTILAGIGILALAGAGLFFLIRAWFRGPNPGPF
jgi:hypothetical protein